MVTPPTEPMQRKRRWLSPRNWRFYVFLLPALFWGGLAILFFWPGLSCSWRPAQWLYAYRERLGPAWSELDHAAFRCGPLGMEMIDYPSRFSTSGFFSEGGATDPVFGFGWGTGLIFIKYWK